MMGLILLPLNSQRNLQKKRQTTFLAPFFFLFLKVLGACWLLVCWLIAGSSVKSELGARTRPGMRNQQLQSTRHYECHSFSSNSDQATVEYAQSYMSPLLPSVSPRLCCHQISTADTTKYFRKITMSDSQENEYSPTDIAEALLDFYRFLTTLHYDAKYLKIPPPEGWPGLDPLLDHLGRSDYVRDVMKQVPYFDNDCKSNIHYKSRFVDYPTLPEDCFENVMDWRLGWDDANNQVWSNRRDAIVDLSDFFPLALGRETWGRHL